MAATTEQIARSPSTEMNCLSLSGVAASSASASATTTSALPMSARLNSKLSLVSPTPDEQTLLLERLRLRLEEGKGETLYSVGQAGENESSGLTRAELNASCLNLVLLASKLNAACTPLRELCVDHSAATQSKSIQTNLGISTGTMTAADISPSSSPADTPNGTAKLSIGDAHPHVALSVNGSPSAVATPKESNSATASVSQSSTPTPAGTVKQGALLQCDMLVRRNADSEADFLDVRIAVVGNVDSGKSTLLGVLTHCELDNGRGLARQRLFRHKHEAETGRTSSIGNDILGFDSQGHVVNKPEHGKLDWTEICSRSSKICTFIDLAGHERYLKTTVFGMTGHAPDYSMLMVGSNMGLVGTTREHLGLALALSVPVFVVLTKVDLCPPNVLDDTARTLTRLLKSPSCRKIPYLVQNTDDVIFVAYNFTSQKLCPIFKVSNVTGENLDLLRLFMNLLPIRTEAPVDGPAEFHIDEIFNVPGAGTVVSGTVMAGVIRQGQSLLLGPDPLGNFQPAQIRSIQRKRLPVTECSGGQTASFSLKKVKRNQVRKGMVMVDAAINPRATWDFEADILILHHPTTIQLGYQAVVHIECIRQTATIVSMSKQCLRTGDRAAVRFRFIKTPEYLHSGVKLIFREGRTKAVGTVTAIFPECAGSPAGARRPSTKQKRPYEPQDALARERERSESATLATSALATSAAPVASTCSTASSSASAMTGAASVSTTGATRGSSSDSLSLSLSDGVSNVSDAAAVSLPTRFTPPPQFADAGAGDASAGMDLGPVFDSKELGGGKRQRRRLDSRDHHMDAACHASSTHSHAAVTANAGPSTPTKTK